MGKKKNNNHNNGQNDDVGDKAEGQQQQVQKNTKNEGGGGRNPLTVVLKIEMHCDGCASKIVKLTRSLDGVESVKADAESNKLTVIGFVDPSHIRDTLHHKTKKKVDLISPQPKKEDKNNKDDNNNNNNKNKDQKPNSDNKKPDADNKKPKDAPVTTAVIKIAFHCQGCIEKICKTVSKTKGVQETSLDKQKETVTVKGTMDVKALTEALKDKLKRPAVIVPPPKKEKDGAGDNPGGNGGGGKKKGGGGQDNGGGGGDAAAAKIEENRLEYMMQPGFGVGGGPGFGYMGQPVNVYGNGYGYMGVAPPPPQPVYDYGYGYGYGHVPGYPVHMKFNDENPNACSVM